MKKEIRYPFEIEGKKYIPLADFSRQIGVPYYIVKRAVEQEKVKVYDMNDKNYLLFEETVGREKAIKYLNGIFLGEDAEQIVRKTIQQYKSSVEIRRAKIHGLAGPLYKKVQSYLEMEKGFELDDEVTRKLTESLEILKYLTKF